MVGSVEGKTPEAKPAPAVEKPQEKAVAPTTQSLIASSEKKPKSLEPWGELVPFGDPSWYQGVCPPLLAYLRHELC